MLLGFNPGVSRIPSWWTGPDVICVECRKPVNKWNGIVCANYLYRRGKFRPCRQGWHGKCYRATSPGDVFPQIMLNDDMQGFMEGPTESERFGFARNGDNYVCPFQCNLCQFRNVHMRDPEATLLDDAMLCCIRRATLDSFWGRAEGRVRANLSSLRNMHERAQANFGLQDLLPAMGPFPLKDTFRMGPAIVMLKHLLDPGRYGDHITFSTLQKYRSSFSNVWGVSVQTLQDSIMARASAKMCTSTCPTNGLWFERFMGGVHSRMGDDHRSEAAISSCVMKLLLKCSEEDLLRTPSGVRRKFLVCAGLFWREFSRRDASRRSSPDSAQGVYSTE